MIRLPPRSTQSRSSAASDVYKRQAYGMPSEGLVLFHYSPAFDVVATEFNDRNDIIVRYADRHVESSGWLSGEKYIAGKTAMASIGFGQGKVVMIGFRTQNRA